jgi:hypothetical protein
MDILEQRTCEQTSNAFAIVQHEQDILQQISPVLWWVSYTIPFSRYHPDVHHQWHLAWRNERTLYKTTCSLTRQSMISCIHPDAGYTVYNFHDRWSDAVDPFAHGAPVNFQQTFTHQFERLFRSMPQMSLQLSPHMQNCDYCNYGLSAKNCYMCTTAVYSEQCYYSYLPFKCYYDVDGYANTDCQYTYACVYAMGCYASQYIYYSKKCTNSHFLLDCMACDYCFWCVNLSHKKYCFFNQQLDKQTYNKRLQEYRSAHTHEQIKTHIDEFFLQHPRREIRGHGNEEVIGDLNFNMTRSYMCFDMQDAKDMTYCWLGGVQSSDFVRTTLVGLSTRLYDSIWLASSDSCAWCIGSNNCYQVFYSYYCRDCEYCFWCVRLMHKTYCIFNVQYTKQEYEELLPQLIQRMQQTGEWWSFFSPSISPFWYNDTCAAEWFPETKSSVLEKGRKRKDKVISEYNGTLYTIRPIHEYVQEEHRYEILHATLVCSESKRPYKIIQQELDFYIKFSLPIPDKHPEQRYKEMFLRWILPRTLYKRTCGKTWQDIHTPYAPERLETVRSEAAWDKEFLG